MRFFANKKQLLIANLTIFLLVSLAIFLSSLNYFWPVFSHEYPLGNVAVAQTTDKTPPVISDISVDQVTATSTTISWQTDKAADSLLNYNIRRDYGLVRDPELVTKHQLVVPDLAPNQLYFYRIIASDKDGNQNISNDYNFTTQAMIGEEQLPTEEDASSDNLVPVSQTQLIKQTINLVNQINTESGLTAVAKAVQGRADEVAKPPVISGDFAKVEVGADYAIVKWKTDKEANSMVALVADKDYNPDVEEPYRWKEGEADQMTTEHEVTVQGLAPATVYHYQVQSTSVLGLQGVSSDNTFKTKSVLPQIFNANMSKVEEDAATIDFSTNIPSSAIVEYTDLATNVTKLAGDTTLSTVHSIRLQDLKFDNYYSAVIKAENEQGEKTVSEPLTFTTVKDVLAPVISKVNTESTLYPGAENKTQTIISWRSDEPSMCQFFYGQGLTAADNPSFLPKEEDYTTNHVQVVTAFQPATVYKFWIDCYDKTLNKTKSEDYTMLTPAREQSILDMIIKNFEGTFGWLKKM